VCGCAPPRQPLCHDQPAGRRSPLRWEKGKDQRLDQTQTNKQRPTDTTQQKQKQQQQQQQKDDNNSNATTVTTNAPQQKQLKRAQKRNDRAKDRVLVFWRTALLCSAPKEMLKPSNHLLLIVLPKIK